MTAKLIDGKAIAQEVRDGVAAAVAKRIVAGKSKPTLATVLVGDRVDSATYVKNQRQSLRRTWDGFGESSSSRGYFASRSWRS